MDFGKIPAYQPDLLQLAQTARDTRQQRASRHRRHDVAWKTPPELLGDLEAHRLRAFRVVRAQVDVREAPAETVCNLRAEAIHVVVVAPDADDVRMEDRGAEDLSKLEIVRDEDEAFEAKARRVRRHAVRKVAGRRTPEYIEPELDCPCRRD